MHDPIETSGGYSKVPVGEPDASITMPPDATPPPDDPRLPGFVLWDETNAALLVSASADFSAVGEALVAKIEPVLDEAEAQGWRRGEETFEEWAERLKAEGSDDE